MRTGLDAQSAFSCSVTTCFASLPYGFALVLFLFFSSFMFSHLRSVWLTDVSKCASSDHSRFLHFLTIAKLFRLIVSTTIASFSFKGRGSDSSLPHYLFSSLAIGVRFCPGASCADLCCSSYQHFCYHPQKPEAFSWMTCVCFYFFYFSSAGRRARKERHAADGGLIVGLILGINLGSN